MSSKLNLANFPLLDSLQLIRSENVGPVTFFQLVARYGSPADALKAIPELARRGGKKRALTVASRAEADKELTLLEKAGARVVAYGSAEYPQGLKQIHDAPPLLFVRGQTHLWQKRCVALVGSRNASAAGCSLTRKLARDCGEAGFTVVSGLARGIDAAAHQGALRTGTVGVIAGGIDTIYPPENRTLYDALYESGAVVSESPLGSSPQRQRFHGRNRIISGFSEGTVVVEAAPQSGSLITARFALEQNREVMAIPGTPLDPRSKGTNDLIRQGAILVTSIEDILEALNRKTHILPLQEPQAPDFMGLETALDESALDSVRNSVMTRLGPVALEVDALATELAAPVPLLRSALLELELAGRLRRYPGDKVALVPEEENEKQTALL